MKKSLGAKTLIFPTPVWAVGTYDQEGKPNLATIAWGGMCCSKPPCVGISLRKATYSYHSIIQRKAFTVNVPSENYVKEADYLGMASGREIDKFASAKLTPVRSEFVDAPYVEEFPLILECRLLQSVEIGLHTQFIGEILDVKADEAVIGTRNLPAIENVKPVIYAPEIQAYYGIGEYLGQAFSIGKQLSKDENTHQRPK